MEFPDTTMTNRKNRNLWRWAIGTGLTIGTAVCLVVATLPVHAQTVSFSSTRDCDNNAVIECGAMTVSELQEKYNSIASVRAIYEAFGISRQSIADMPNMTVAGTVTRSGTVVVNGKVVANNALTAGRQNIAGSTRMTMGGVTFYERRPSVSFASDNLDAFVVMHNGQFQFAILASCGNPVRATSVTKPKPAPAPKPTPTPPPPPTPTPTPPATTTPSMQQQQQQQQQQVVVVQPAKTVVKQAPAPMPKPTPTSPPAPAPAPQAQTQVQAQPQTLPSTGAGDILGIFAGSSVLGTLGAHFWFKRRGADISPII